MSRSCANRLQLWSKLPPYTCVCRSFERPKHLLSISHAAFVCLGVYYRWMQASANLFKSSKLITIHWAGQANKTYGRCILKTRFASIQANIFYWRWCHSRYAFYNTAVCLFSLDIYIHFAPEMLRGGKNRNLFCFSRRRCSNWIGNHNAICNNKSCGVKDVSPMIIDDSPLKLNYHLSFSRHFSFSKICEWALLKSFYDNQKNFFVIKNFLTESAVP